MAEGFGIQGAAGVQSNLSGVTTSQAADAAANLPQAPTKDAGRQPGVQQTSTAYVSDPAVGTQVHSKVVARLLEQNATIYGPGLAQVRPQSRPDGTPRTQPKKPAGPMVAPRSLDSGKSPLAPTSLFDARASLDALGVLPNTGHDVEADWNGRLDALEAFLEGSA